MTRPYRTRRTTAIDNLVDFSDATKAALKRARVKTLGDLLAKSLPQVRRINGIGPTLGGRINSAVKAMGYELAEA